MFKYFRDLTFYTVALWSMIACKKNYIDYYNKVNEIDSIYRKDRNAVRAINEYKDIFKKYTPKNQERIEEYANYIMLSDQQQMDFGGRASLTKLIQLTAPYENKYKQYMPIFIKYGFDNEKIEQIIADEKKGIIGALRDSFKVALVRDQIGRPRDTALVYKNAQKNSNMLLWTFKNYGFPSQDKIGGFPMPTFLSHMSESKKNYPIIKKKLYEYVMSGDCSPRDYARMVDAEVGARQGTTIYGFNAFPISDSSAVNRNRKKIGIPSLKQSANIRKDYFNKLKINDTHYIE